MQNIKFIGLLQSFTPDEVKKFEKFIASPFFSTGRDLTSIFKIIKSFYPDFSHRDFTVEFIFKNLFPGKKFEEKSSANLINTMTSELFRLGKHFLIQLELEADPAINKYFLLNGLMKKNHIDEFEKENKKITEYEKEQLAGGSEYFVNKYILNKPYAEYYFTKRQDFERGFDSIAKRAAYLTVAAIISDLNNIEQQSIAEKAYRTKARRNIADVLISNLNMKNMMNELKESDDEYYKFVAINYLAYLMYTNPEDENYYFELKQMVYDNYKLFTQKERFVLFGKLKSYCSEKISQNENQKFTREEFELNVKTLEIGCYKYGPEGMMEPVIYRNILFSAIDCEEFIWLEDFINEYSEELSPDQRENMRYYSLAHLNYAKKNYEGALENLIKVKYEFFLFKIDVKYLMFKIYYEMELFENAISVINTMKQYVENTKDLSDLFKARYRNFVKYSNGLLKTKLTGNKKEPGLLRRKIENEKNLFSGRWLIEKIDEIVKN